MANDDSSAAATDGRPSRLTPQRVATAAALTAVAIIGAIYWMYVRNERTYYVGRNLRLLGLMTQQLNDVIDTNAGYVRNAVRIGDPAPVTITPNCADPKELKGPELEERTPIVMGSKTILRVKYIASVAPNSVAPNATPSTWTPSKATPIVKSGCSDVDLDALLSPAFDIELAGRAFDAVVVASPDGHILYRTSPTLHRSFLFANKAPSSSSVNASTVPIGELRALEESAGWLKTKPLDVPSLMMAGRATNVTLAGEPYVLFSQPYLFAASQKWIVCGLVSGQRFRFDTMAIPTPIVMLAMALALLAICSWPFLRLALINDLEPITISDAVLLAVCTIIAAAIVTLGALDLFAYHRISQTATQQLQGFGERLHDAYRRDVNHAASVAACIRGKTMNAKWSPTSLLDTVGQDSEVRTYPYVTSFAWIDANGVEQFKFPIPDASAPNPRVDVSRRQYFQDVKGLQGDVAGNPLWLTDGPNPVPYSIQWVRSASTGKVTAAIAEATDPKETPSLPVVVLATKLIDVSSAVRPPGVDFAIIDEQGNVVYHSEEERIGHENLFVETDQNRRLRSAVIGRSRAFVEASYWGDNTEMYVRPVSGSPWTLVVFRAKRFIRVLNIEAVLLTLLLLLVNALPYAFLYAVILIAKPRYRAPSLWPDETRRFDYIRLCVVYLLLIGSFSLAIYALDAVSLFGVVFLFPLQAIVTTYVVLHPRRRRFRDSLFLVAWIAVTIALIVAMFLAHADVRMAPGPLLLLARVGSMLLVLAASGLAAVRRFALLERWSRPSYGSAYRTCGALLLAIGAALPAVGFFKLGTHIEKELFVKGAQLRLAAMIEARVSALASMTLNRDRTVDDIVHEQPTEVFHTTWCLDPPPGRTPCTTCGTANWPAAIPPEVAERLPDFSEDFVEMRHLHASKSEDGLWKWCSGKGGALTLDRTIRLPEAVTNEIYPGSQPPQQHLLLTSAAIGQGEAHRWPSWRLLLASLLLIVIGFGLFRLAAAFIAQRLFLIGLAEPSWMKKIPLSPTLGDHLFVMRRTKRADELVRMSEETKPYLDVSFATMDADDSWNRRLAAIDHSAAGRNVRITDFEYAIDDAATNGRKLLWLERLLALSDRTIVVVSSVSPAYIYTAPSATDAAGAVQPLPDRWHALINKFVLVTEEQLELRSAVQPSGFLAELSDELKSIEGPSDELPQRVIDEIMERAHTYFAGLWASCSMNERVLLYQLARNGLINGKDRRLVRRLMARGFIKRSPQLDLFSEGFRRYVLRSAERQELKAHSESLGGSRWKELRAALAILVLAGVLMLFATQKDLLTTVQGLVTSLTASVPLLIKLVGVLSDRRLDAGTHA